MSKAEKTQPAVSENSSSDGRSPERATLAAAILARNEADAQESALVQARERAKAAAFLARRDAEAAERALTKAQEARALELADAYVGGEEIDDTGVEDATRALGRAERRLADLALIEKGLAAGPQPGRSVPSLNVEQAVRDVVKACPIVRRLAEDYRTAERTFRVYEATLSHLAARGMIPDDLVSAAPSKNTVRYADPDPGWLAAVEALRVNPDAELPS